MLKQFAVHFRNLPRLTDGYAPRCLVTEGIAGSVQYSGGGSIRYPVRTNVDASWREFTTLQDRKVVTWKGYS